MQQSRILRFTKPVLPAKPASPDLRPLSADEIRDVAGGLPKGGWGSIAGGELPQVAGAAPDQLPKGGW